MTLFASKFHLRNDRSKYIPYDEIEKKENLILTVT